MGRDERLSFKPLPARLPVHMDPKPLFFHQIKLNREIDMSFSLFFFVHLALLTLFGVRLCYPGHEPRAIRKLSDVLFQAKGD